MQMRRLGETGLEIAPLVLGGNVFGWTVDEKKFYTKGSHSPFIGRELKGKAVMTLVDGNIVMQDGIING